MTGSLSDAVEGRVLARDGGRAGSAGDSSEESRGGERRGSGDARQGKNRTEHGTRWNDGVGISSMDAACK
eukprot:59983-Rhodomonas_salina.2